MEDCILAYAAGILDGEGCVSISKAPSGGKFRMRVSIGNNDPRMLLFLQEHFGGSINKFYSGNDVNRPGYMWGVSGSHAGVFLRLIYPYVRCKREQIEVVLDYLSTSDWNKRTELYERCKKLKKIRFE